jgi:WD40 repeat protein
MDSLTESVHPSVSQLRTFGLGQMNAAEAAVIEEHVSHCDACCRTLADVRSDTFIDILRSSSLSAPGVPASESLTEAPDRPRPVADSGRTSADSPAEPDLISAPTELLQHPRYRILGLLGSGGMGAVYKAEHRLMERVVALKVMTRALVASAATVERFRREFTASARLSHANIVAAYDAEQAGDLPFLVMEFVEGSDLARWVVERGPLPVAEACEYVRQAALGLQHAHEHGMIHRDIKPHNMMRTPDGTVKILDFGLARLVADATSGQGGVTGQGILLGTVDYLAPEQADDARRADIRSDIYSLGCTLYHLLSGRPPFPQGTMVQKIMAHTERDPLPIQELRPDLPPGLARVVSRMMAKSPDERYQTPSEVCAALARFAGQTVVLDPAPVPRKRPAGGSRRRRWPVAVAALLLVLVGLAAAAVAVYRIQTDNGELVIRTDDPDVEVVIRQNGELVRIIDTKTDKEVRLDSGKYELELKGQPDDLKLSLDKVTIRRGETVVATVERRLKRVAAAAEPPAEVSRHAFDGSEGVPAHIYHVTFSPDGRYFLAAGDAGNRSPVRVYDGRTGKLVSQFAPQEAEGWSAASFSPDGTQVVSWGNGRLHLWAAATGKEIGKLEGHTGPVLSGVFSPDGKRIVSASWDKTLRIWDAATGKELHRLDKHTDGCVGLFSPDGDLVVSFSPDGTLRAWDAQTGKEVWKQEGQLPPDDLSLIVYGSVFPSAGRQVLSFGGDGRIRVWETPTGKPVRELKAGADTQRTQPLPGGRQLASWGKDKTLHVWDLTSGKEVRGLGLGEDWQGEPDSVAVSPDGRRVLTAHTDQTVRLRDLATGQELHRYAATPQIRTRGLAFSPDGRFAAAGSFRGWVYLWRLPAPPAK